MDKQRFMESCERIINKKREKSGIGTLGEKTLHAVLKDYFEPYTDNQEVKMGAFVADIVCESGIVEIQTGNFNKLRKKLESFLEVSAVTVVYPVPGTKWIVWIDSCTGEVTNKRKSPKKGSFYDAFPELYKIKPFLTHENFKLCIVLIDIVEYRNLDGWSADGKKGSTRCERIPVDLIDELHIENTGDYIRLIPDNMPQSFTSRDFKKLSGLSLKKAQTAINVLQYTGAVKYIGKDGRLHLYEKQSERII
ncbi:hypothetical protein LY28_02413 [Ruminiclostridium sufflavum DSM 19573]|uniref:DUF8091 domain-containing protein n=1 Tax=Ruminiclostridium sufflavum DSM 19573 TaxID=1121337 RepID=A0A318XII0_9FIRM|nr:hypothetical protein [Ruminiclostridium sufflavum]PYG87030.1 hypothetical protein LY28_02413 [Ruminiclostridium sufflavum DSM 19573]